MRASRPGQDGVRTLPADPASRLLERKTTQPIVLYEVTAMAVAQATKKPTAHSAAATPPKPVQAAPEPRPAPQPGLWTDWVAVVFWACGFGLLLVMVLADTLWGMLGLKWGG
jgi:hypothetical protein